MNINNYYKCHLSKCRSKLFIRGKLHTIPAHFTRRLCSCMEASSRYSLCALCALCTMAQFAWCCYLAWCERRPRLQRSPSSANPLRPRPLTRMAACMHAGGLTAASASLTLLLLADDIDNAQLCSVAGY